ncbi:MAG: hypothetical protein ACYCOU_06830 [Sulfobacillus sp.]
MSDDEKQGSLLRAFFVTSRKRETVLICAFGLLNAIAWAEAQWGDDTVINCQEIGPVTWVEDYVEEEETRILN